MRADPIRDSSIAKVSGPLKVMFFLHACSLLAACGLINNNLSRHEYFAPMVGADLTLQRKAYLCESSWSGPWPDTRTYSLVRLVSYENNCSTMYRGTIIDELEVGTPLRIHRVYEYSEFNTNRITAVGEILGHEFEYNWGARMMPIYLAPWEQGPFDPNRCFGSIWEECKSARGSSEEDDQD